MRSCVRFLERFVGLVEIGTTAIASSSAAITASSESSPCSATTSFSTRCRPRSSLENSNTGTCLNFGELPAATREPGGWGRCPATRARRQTDEDLASRRVGGLQPKMHSLGVAGEFGDVAESAQNTRRGRRVRPSTPLGGPPGHGEYPACTSTPTRGSPARRPRRRGGTYSNSRRSKLLGRPSVQRRARCVGSLALGAGNRLI